MLKKRLLGHSDLTISSIGFGCMGMSDFYGPSDDEQSLQTLECALDQGINFFDTADMYGYGHNEELLGRFLKGKRDKVVLATKFGISQNPLTQERIINNSPAYIEQACEASLRRLKTDVIDLYYCHRRNQETPIEEMMEALAKLVKAGKIRAIGLSEVVPETLRTAHIVHPVSAVQSEYSLWNRPPENEMLATCKDLGVTFVAYAPLGRGFLTGTLADPENLPKSDRRSQLPRFSGAALAKNSVLVRALSDFAKGKGVTPAQICLAWISCKQDNVVPIPGTKRRERLLENVAATALRLTTEEITTLDEMFAPENVEGDRYPVSGAVGVETMTLR